MTEKSSRILTLSSQLTDASKIPQAQVNNPEVLELTPLSPTQIQVFAKKPGVTQVNLWDENGDVFTVDVIVYADARELSMLLETEFPNAALEVKPMRDGVLISGYVDQPDDARNIVGIAEQFYQKVLTNIRVGGVHQVLLHVKAMEVSRTKLRSLGFDWTYIDGESLVSSGVSGLLGTVGLGSFTTGPAATVKFDIVDGDTTFMGVLEALRQDNLAKILAEPTLVTTSGRPAFFHVGGEVPYLVPQGLGTTAIEYKEYGTRVDFVPIVLGNGRIRLEVRPRVSDIDAGRSIVVDGQVVYAFSKHEVDTGVEMQAGQTLAIAGLVQNRIESQRRGLPVIGEMPYVGPAFRRVEEQMNEIELLVFVTPELVDAMDAEEVPPCGPGLRTASPGDCELYMKGYVEVPNCCPPGAPGTLDPPGAIPTSGDLITAPGEILIESPRTRGSMLRVAPAAMRRHDPSRPHNRAARAGPGKAASELPGFMGPIGYDALK